MEDVARETLGVNANERVFAVADLTIDEGNVLLPVDVISVTDNAPGSVIRGQTRLGLAMHEPFTLQPIGDELRDGDERDLVLLGEDFELWAPGGRAVFIQDLAYD